uniref:F-box domain-containing protein n=1 Tax=Meloidogyne incognita TaxID=6306 RepID=A0A914NU32_MELIC
MSHNGGSSQNNGCNNDRNDRDNGSSRRLRGVQKGIGQCSWRSSCNKRKRKTTGSTSRQSVLAAAALRRNMPFQLDVLPFDTLANAVAYLPFDDFAKIGLVSKKFHKVQNMTRYSRKHISVGLLRRLFPDAIIPSPSTTSCVGMLQVMRPLRRALRSYPSGNINEVDLSELLAFRESHFEELLKSINNGKSLFTEVRRLNVRGCVVEPKDIAFLAQLMPKVWFVRCSPQTLVLPEEIKEHLMLTAEQQYQLRNRVEDYAQLCGKLTQRQLLLLSQLTEQFPCLEMVQLDKL